MTEIEKYEGGAEIVTRRDMRNQTTDSWTDVLPDVVRLAENIAKTDFVPASFKGSVPAVAATILQGRELGFAPMTALGSLHSIKGKVGLYAEAMRALVLQAGHEIVVSETTAARCVMKGRRNGSDEWTTVVWTIADARAAGLLQQNKNWQTYPRQMLTARASTELCRLAFPDVIRGLASVEELDQYDVLPTGEPAPVVEAKADEGNTVQRAPRKRAARAKAPKAETPDEPLPEDEADTQTPAESGDEQSGAGEAPTDLAGSVGSDPAGASTPSTPQDGAADPAREDSGSDDAGALSEDDPGSSPSDDEPVPEDVEAEVVDEPDPDPDEPEPEDVVDAEVIHDEAAAEPRMSVEQRPALMAAFSKLGIKDKAERMQVTVDLIGRAVTSANELSVREASSVIDTLVRCGDRDDLENVIQATVNHREGRA